MQFTGHAPKLQGTSWRSTSPLTAHCLPVEIAWVMLLVRAIVPEPPQVTLHVEKSVQLPSMQSTGHSTSTLQGISSTKGPQGVPLYCGAVKIVRVRRRLPPAPQDWEHTVEKIQGLSSQGTGHGSLLHFSTTDTIKVAWLKPSGQV